VTPVVLGRGHVTLILSVPGRCDAAALP
jgi:hypothetical protein